MANIYFSIGTNIGDREENIRQTLIALQEMFKLDALSTLYETAPWGPIQDQPSFLNLCAAARSDMTPLDVLHSCKRIEEEIGRVEGLRWGPRLIDIDLLFYDGLVLDEDRLTLPHPQIEKRGFVLIPLADIAPQLVHPVHQKSITALLELIDVSDVTPFVTRKPVYLGGRRPLIWGQKTGVMGILNASPDSFSDDGFGNDKDWIERAADRAEYFVHEGADFLDIGGQSTRPGATPVLPEEESARVIPLVEAVRNRLPEVIISIDSFRAEVAHKALRAGADWINDVTGLQNDEEMIEVILAHEAPVILMHNGRGRQQMTVDDGYGRPAPAYHYADLIEDVAAEMGHLRDQVTPFHLSPQKIILDPGIGFGKAGPQNIQLISHLSRFKELGLPLLLGSSRKGFIGHYLGDVPPSERLAGTAVTNTIGILQGADIIRVHDVSFLAQVARMTDAFVRQG